MKFCPKCKKSKSKSEFNKNKNCGDGLCSYCKACVSRYNKEYYNNPSIKEARKMYYKTAVGREVQRKFNLKRYYGITIEEYDNILESQGGVCAICGTDKGGCSRRFAVDHCHITNEVRGLLCASCNNGLGRFKDNISILDSAIKYLQEKQTIYNAEAAG